MPNVLERLRFLGARRGHRALLVKHMPSGIRLFDAKRALLFIAWFDIGGWTKAVKLAQLAVGLSGSGDRWIGKGCIVNGNGGVAAACACVVRDVPDDALVGGVPARVIRELGDARG